MNNINELETLDTSGFNTLNTKVSDVITVEAILSMPENSSLFLTVGTGGGKTYFATHTLYEAAKQLGVKILVFENRVNTRTQMEAEIDRQDCSDYISVKSYQAYETLAANQKEFNLDGYDIIVLDEYHHICIDSILPGAYYTYDVIPAVMQHPCRRIFMSATPRGLDKHIQGLHGDEVPYWELNIPMDYSKVCLKHFYINEQLNSIANEVVNKNEKGVFFLKDTSEAVALRDTYPQSLYMCSVHNKSNPMTSAEEKLREIILTNPDVLPGQFLFTTTSLDVGVSLHDPEIKTVVSNILDIEQNIQCLGRRRLCPEQTISFYLRDYSIEILQNKYESIQKRYEKCLFLNEYGTTAFVEKYGLAMSTENDSILHTRGQFEEHVVLAPIMGRLLYVQDYLKRLEAILNSGKSYVDYIRDEYGFDKTSDKMCNCDFRMTLLKSNVGRVFFTTQERNEFIRSLKLYDRSGHVIRGRQKANEYLKKNNIPFVFVEMKRRQIGGRDYRHITELQRVS